MSPSAAVEVIVTMELHNIEMKSSEASNCSACGKNTNGGNHECSVCDRTVHNSAYSYDASRLNGNAVEYCSLASTVEEEVVTCKSHLGV